MKYSKKGFSPKWIVGLFSIIFLCVAVSAHAQVTIPYTFTSGTTISSSEVNSNFTALKNAVDPLLISNFTSFTNLNSTATNVSSTYTKLNTTATSHTFTKSSANTKIEVHVNSRFLGGTFGGGATWIEFQVRIDDTPTTLVDNLGSIVNTDTSEFQSILAVFEGLAAGQHTVSLWAKTDTGTSTGVIVDEGGFGGAIIVKEVQ
jgi:hypothetical protein